MANEEAIIAELKRKGFEGLVEDLKKAGNSFEELSKIITKANDGFSIQDKHVENARTTLLNYKNQIVQVNQELHKLSEENKQGTPRFQELTEKVEHLTKKAGELKLGIQVAQKEIQAFGTQTQGLDKFIRAVELGVNSVEVFKGAQVLLGFENKKLEETLVKLNAIMVLSNGLQRIGAELARDDSIAKLAAAKATQLYNFVVGESTGALKLFKVAVASTGIGLLILAIPALIEAFKELTVSGGFLGNVLGGIKDVISASIQGYKDLADAIGLTNFAAKEAAEDEKKRQEDALYDLSRQGDLKVALLRAQHKNTLDAEAQALSDEFQAKRKIFNDNLESFSAEELKKRREELDKLSDALKVKRAEVAQREKDDAKKLIEENAKEDIRLLKATGKEREALVLAIAQTEANVKTAITDIEKKKAINDNLEAIQALKKFDDDLAKKKDDLAKKALAKLKQNQEDALKLIDEFYKKQASDAAAAQKIIDDQQDVEIADRKARAKIKQDIEERLSKSFKEQLDERKKDEDAAAEADDERIKKSIDDAEKKRQKDKSIRDERIEDAKAINVALASFTSELFNYELASLQEKKNKGIISEKQYAKEVAAIKRKQAVAAKIEAAFNIGINIAEAISKAFAQTGILGFITAGIVTTLGLAQLAIVASTPIPQAPGFFKGVIDIPLGRNRKGKDTIPALLHEGESVMTAEETKKHKPVLQAIRDKKFNQLFIPANLAMNADIFSKIPNAANIPHPVKSQVSDNLAIENKLKMIHDELYYLNHYTKSGNQDQRNIGDKITGAIKQSKHNPNL